MADMKGCISIAVTVLLASPAAPAQVKKQISEAAAIRLAEQFVADNGYTDSPPVEDKSNLSAEGIDPADPDARLKVRFNTLAPKAYAVGRGKVEKYGWTIVFRYNADNEHYRRAIPNYRRHIKQVGRAVTMNADGSHIRMQHQDIYLKGLKAIKPDGG